MASSRDRFFSAACLCFSRLLRPILLFVSRPASRCPGLGVSLAAAVKTSAFVLGAIFEPIRALSASVAPSPEAVALSTGLSGNKRRESAGGPSGFAPPAESNGCSSLLLVPATELSLNGLHASERGPLMAVSQICMAPKSANIVPGAVALSMIFAVSQFHFRSAG